MLHGAKRRATASLKNSETVPEFFIFCTAIAIGLACGCMGQQHKEITNSIGMKTVFIPHGTFKMGSPPSEQKRNADEVQHEVTITRDFYLGAYEVTQSQYKRVMGHNPSKFQDAVVDHVNEDLPVDFVRWQDAVEFCARLTAIDEENISGRVYRLAT